MPPKVKVFNIDVRSQDRDRRRFPSANDFSIDLGHTYYGCTSLKLGSLEVPKTRYTLESTENNVYFSEGVVVGDHEMAQPYNAITVTENGGAPVELVVPATLMPVSNFQPNQIDTPQKHGLLNFMAWSAQDPKRPRAILVGAEPGPKATAAHRIGFFLDQLPNLQFPTETSMTFDDGIVESMGIGSSTTGYIYVPPLHIQELLSLLTYIGAHTWSLEDGAVQVGPSKNADIAVGSTAGVSSLGPLLGYNAPLFRAPRARNMPAVPRAAVPPGFYANPPSLIANATEEALHSRGLFTAPSTFKITQMDAFFSEKVTIPQGLFTPELLAQTLRNRVTDTHFVCEHVDDDGNANDNYVRWTVRSAEDFPFTLDFSEAGSVAAARALGFRQRRYTGRTYYVGEAYVVPATRNLQPAPAPSAFNGVMNGNLLNAVSDEYRYPKAVYTITGTTPSRQTFSLFSEPGQSWAVPNQGTSKNYYESIRNKGIIDITTKNMPRQQSYGFRRGDVMRLTGISQESVTLSTFVNTGFKSSQINGTNVLNGVVAVVADKMGGEGYLAAPAVTVLTTPVEGNAPTITAVVKDGKVVAYEIQNNTGARFDRAPTIAVDAPKEYTVENASFATMANPERKVLTLTLDEAPVNVAPGKGVVLTGSNGLDRVYEVLSVAGTDVEVAQEDLDGAVLNAGDAVGASVRFSVSDVSRVASLAQSNGINTVALSGAMAEATMGKALLFSGVLYDASPTNITGLAGGTFSHGGNDVSQGDRLVLRGTDADGVWVVDTAGAGEFTLVGGGPGTVSGAAAFVVASSVTEKAPVNASLTVGKPLSKPTTSFEAPGIPYPAETGFGGLCVFSPTPSRAHAVATLFDDSIQSVMPSVPGFLNASSSVSDLSSSGGPIVTMAGGATTTDVFNTRASAEVSSVTVGGQLVSGNDAHVVIGDETYSVLYGEFESATELAVVVSRDVAATGDLTLENFYFDNTYTVWNAVGNRITITNNAGWASVSLNGVALDATTAGTLFPSTMFVEWPGQYTGLEDANANAIGASMTVTNNVTTRVGLCTYAAYEKNYFRYVIEYNHRGVNGGRGFYDSIAGNRNIVLTFSRMFGPRTEWFGASSSAMHRLTREGRMMTKFQNQILLRRLGVTRDVFGETNYMADSQWFLDSQPYRLLQFLDESGQHLGASTHLHVMDERTTPVFGKLIIPSAYNTIRFQGFNVDFDRPRNLQRIRIRLLDFDETPYPLHGRDLSFSLLLTTNPERQ